MSDLKPAQSLVARVVRGLAVPILLIWIGLAAATNLLVPQLEVVGSEHNVSLSPTDAPSMQAMKRIGKVFEEFDSDSMAMIVLEGEQPLGDEAHTFYDSLIDQLEQDTTHVQHISDLWGDPLTAAGSQSADGKAAYVQVYLAGSQGEAVANESVNALRDIVERATPPDGVKAYVTGAAPLMADQFQAGSGSSHKVTLITLVVVAVMLMFVYRSVITTVLVLAFVLIETAASRGVVAFLANQGLIGLSTFATNILTLLAIAAGTDYAMFFLGRYHEARQASEDRETAYYSMFRGTAHVVAGSGLTIAGAVFCLSFTRLPYFQTLGVPGATGILVALAASLTLAPAVVVVASHFGLLEPKRTMRTRRWRRIGTAIVRWPGPILIATCAVSLVGLLALPGYQTSFDGRPYMPNAPSNVGYAAAARHFPTARLNPELLMLETDHDMRNPADMLVLERVAKAIFHTPGIALVQGITRPLGTPLEHSTIPFHVGAQSNGQVMNLQYQQDRVAELLIQAGEIDKSIALLERQLSIQQELNANSDELNTQLDQTIDIVYELRNSIANFDDFFRPVRNYFYWEPHCFDIPSCAAIRSVFDALDGISALTDRLDAITANLDKSGELQPQLMELISPQIESQRTNRELLLRNYATQAGILDQTRTATENSGAMGQAFDTAKNDDSFYLPPDALESPDFQRALNIFLSPDGKAARMIITHKGDPASAEGISHVDDIANATEAAIKGTPLDGARISLGGTASTNKDIKDGAFYDLLIAAISALSLILLIMMFVTRSLIAALVIVGTVALSLGASFGLSVLIWQYLLGIPLYWMVLALAVIVLLAVGSDYNLLLISRFREEIGAGLHTGTIRAMASTGSVVTSAGLVFAATMASFVFSDLLILAQVGTTIALGLLFDTMVVRAFMTPAIATLLGRWFWWPQRVRPRPASSMLRPYGTRRTVRELLERE